MLFGASWGSWSERGPDKSYEERIRILLTRGIAVWDVLKSCVRPGSLDAEIRDEVPNDLAAFFAAHPRIARVGLNGGKAAASFRAHAARHFPPGVIVAKLPSTSPACGRRSFEEKCAMWRSGLGLDASARDGGGAAHPEDEVFAPHCGCLMRG